MDRLHSWYQGVDCPAHFSVAHLFLLSLLLCYDYESSRIDVLSLCCAPHGEPCPAWPRCICVCVLCKLVCGLNPIRHDACSYVFLQKVRIFTNVVDDRTSRLS